MGKPKRSPAQSPARQRNVRRLAGGASKKLAHSAVFQKRFSKSPRMSMQLFPKKGVRICNPFSRQTHHRNPSPQPITTTHHRKPPPQTSSPV
jgi:hypothetical protein